MPTSDVVRQMWKTSGI